MNKKSGFTLAEMMISMLVVSIFFAAFAQTLTYKKPKEVQITPHGFFECYYRGGQLYVHTYKDNLRGRDKEPNQSTNCNFQPPVGLTFINVHYLNTNNEKPYFNSPEPVFDRQLEISSPDSIEAFYPQYFGGTNDSLFSDDAEDFKAYLERAHPKSMIYKLWQNGEEPQSALFISW